MNAINLQFTQQRIELGFERFLVKVGVTDFHGKRKLLWQLQQIVLQSIKLRRSKFWPQLQKRRAQSICRVQNCQPIQKRRCFRLCPHKLMLVRDRAGEFESKAKVVCGFCGPASERVRAGDSVKRAVSFHRIEYTRVFFQPVFPRRFEIVDFTPPLGTYPDGTAESNHFLSYLYLGCYQCRKARVLSRYGIAIQYWLTGGRPLTLDRFH